jgi:hypothetical protein
MKTGSRLAAVCARTAAFVFPAVAVPALALVLGAACSSAPKPGTPIDQTISLSAGQAPYRLVDGAEVRFANVVNDSRCPVDATCVWAGTATINLAFKPAGASDELEVLAVLPGGVSPDDVASLIPVDADGYRITLTRLDPVPRTDAREGAAGGSARATLRIEKQVAP